MPAFGILAGYGNHKSFFDSALKQEVLTVINSGIIHSVVLQDQPALWTQVYQLHPALLVADLPAIGIYHSRPSASLQSFGVDVESSISNFVKSLTLKPTNTAQLNGEIKGASRSIVSLGPKQFRGLALQRQTVIRIMHSTLSSLYVWDKAHRQQGKSSVDFSGLDSRFVVRPYINLILAFADSTTTPLSRAELLRHLSAARLLPLYNSPSGRLAMIEEAVRMGIIFHHSSSLSGGVDSSTTFKTYQVARRASEPEQVSEPSGSKESPYSSITPDFYILNPDFRPLPYSSLPFQLPHLPRYFAEKNSSSQAATLPVAFQLLIHVFQIFDSLGRQEVDVLSLR